VTCHKGAQTESLAGFPAFTQCRTCHVDAQERKIPSRLVYEVPDFVFFSHAKHANARVECRTCHGEVAQQEIIQAEQPIRMKWCVDCHKTAKAAVTCNTCHELGQ